MHTNVMLLPDKSKLVQELFKDVTTEIHALSILVMQKPTNASLPELFVEITTCVPLENV
jgi:stress-induced morphogen